MPVIPHELKVGTRQPTRRMGLVGAAATKSTISSVVNTSAKRTNSAFNEALCASSDTVALASETTSVR